MSASNDATLKTWSLFTGAVTKTFKGHTGAVTCFDMSDKVIATGSSDETVRLWNIDYGHQLYVFREKGLGMISSIKLSTFHGIVVAGSYDSNIRVWGVETKKLLKTLKDHKDCVNSLLLYDLPNETPDSFSPLIISGSHDSSIKVWQTKKPKKRKKK
mgnify:CR=1 FL=1